MDIKRPTWRQSQWKLKILPHDPPIPPRYPRAPEPSPQINTLGAQVAQVRLSCLNRAPGGTDGGVGNRFCRDATVPHCWRGRWVLVAPHPRAGAGPVMELWETERVPPRRRWRWLQILVLPLTYSGLSSRCHLADRISMSTEQWKEDNETSQVRDSLGKRDTPTWNNFLSHPPQWLLLRLFNPLAKTLLKRHCSRHWTAVVILFQLRCEVCCCSDPLVWRGREDVNCSNILCSADISCCSLPKV